MIKIIQFYNVQSFFHFYYYYINIVLSKIEYIPKYYKIIRQKNRIYIKCHNYITGYGVDVKYKNIELYTKYSNQTDFIYTYKTLDNYDS